jgi:hypothetical protein
MRKDCAVFQGVALDSARNYFYDQAIYATTSNTPLSGPTPENNSRSGDRN